MRLPRQRLSLLHHSHVISGGVFEAMNRFLDFLETQNIHEDEVRLNMMSTHIAMALMRAHGGESITPADGGLIEEVQGHPAYAKALALWHARADILGILPEGEKYYVLANFCNIIKE